MAEWHDVVAYSMVFPIEVDIHRDHRPGAVYQMATDWSLVDAFPGREEAADSVEVVWKVAVEESSEERAGGAVAAVDVAAVVVVSVDV